ncbi:ABC transporter [Austwickia chelonae]|uniref:AAA+ ATPase domain-containing protein n=1 Tax=Austwickia chelonae NBRC 105200 TaxID=1184607 RepID=K6UM22_9MICO|nr:ATP-binding cassette domain-containing protein [Austwickia chelonae]GAB77736.1 hypothetical protein AUCHE_06_00080 [Austwickia chelonae NBRC 105200]SEV88544.1 ABC transporter [Austwickia chelonae]
MPADRLLHVDALRKAFGDHQLWSALTFSVPAGELLAIRGASGSGKSTLLNCIGLLSTPDSGRIVIDGVDILRVGRRRHRHLRRHALGYLFQDYALMEEARTSRSLPDRAVLVATHSDRVAARCDAELHLSGDEAPQRRES